MFFDFPTGLYHSICNYTDIGLWQIYPFCYKLQKNRSLFKISCPYIPKAHPNASLQPYGNPLKQTGKARRENEVRPFFIYPPPPENKPAPFSDKHPKPP